MIKKYSIGYVLLLYTFYFHATSFMSNSSKTEADENEIQFYGTLLDHTNSQPQRITNILIGGKNKEIYLYAPIDIEENKKEYEKAANPLDNKVIISVKNIKEITLAYPNRPEKSKIKINNNEFIMIQVVLNYTDETALYLVESMRKITCDELNNKNQSIKSHREINFLNIKKLTIDGFTYKNKQTPLNDTKKETAPEKTVISTEKQNSMKTEHTETLHTMINTIKESIMNIHENNVNEIKNHALQKVQDLEEYIINEKIGTINHDFLQQMRQGIVNSLKILKETLKKLANVLH